MPPNFTHALVKCIHDPLHPLDNPIHCCTTAEDPGLLDHNGHHPVLKWPLPGEQGFRDQLLESIRVQILRSTEFHEGGSPVVSRRWWKFEGGVISG